MKKYKVSFQIEDQIKIIEIKAKDFNSCFEKTVKYTQNNWSLLQIQEQKDIQKIINNEA